MNSTVRMLTAALLAGSLGFSGAALANAQEVSVEAEVAATTTRPKPRILPIPPDRINDLRVEAQERIKDLRDGMKDTRIEIRTEMRDASTSDERREIIKNVIEGRAEVRADIRDRAQEIRGDLKQRLQELAKSHIGSILRRSENALNMFGNFVERIETRIEKLQENGANTSSVEASLRASVALVAEAKADHDALARFIASVEASQSADDVRAQIREAVRELTASIKAAHGALLKTARELVQLSVSVRAEASTDN